MATPICHMITNYVMRKLKFRVRSAGSVSWHFRQSVSFLVSSGKD